VIKEVPVSARQRLVDATVAQVRRHGVAGASVSGILEHSGVARRTLYLNFPDGKPALVAAATETAAQFITATLERVLAEGDPVQVVETFIDEWVHLLDSTGCAAGCPIVAAALGRDEAPAAADAAAAAFAHWTDLVTRAGKRSGLGDEAARDLGTTIVAAVEGAVVMSLAQRSTAPLQRVGRDLVLLTTTKTAAAQRETLPERR